MITLVILWNSIKKEAEDTKSDFKMEFKRMEMTVDTRDSGGSV